MKNTYIVLVCVLLLILSSFFPFLEKSIPGKQQTSSGAFSQKSAARQLFVETFEGPTPFAAAHDTDFGTAYSFTVVHTPVFKGKKSARFELRDTDPMVSNGTRAEVTIVKEAVEREMWYSFAVYFPAEDFAPDIKTEIISQWWQAGDKHLGESNTSPATALRIQKDHFIFDTGYNDSLVSTDVIPQSRRKIDLGPVTKDTWHQFVFHFIHSYQSDGLVEIWHNGTKILTHRGGNMYNNIVLPKWKLGIYKWKWNGDGTTATRKRVLYYDNISVGKENVTVAEMTPASIR